MENMIGAFAVDIQQETLQELKLKTKIRIELFEWIISRMIAFFVKLIVISYLEPILIETVSCLNLNTMYFGYSVSSEKSLNFLKYPLTFHKTPNSNIKTFELKNC